MRKINYFFLILTAISIKIILIINLQAVTFEPLPNHPDWYGFYYFYEKAAYLPVLRSDMPHDVMIAYIVADSIAYRPPSPHRWDSILYSMNKEGDTFNFLLKYFYLADEWDAIRCNNFEWIVPIRPPATEPLLGSRNWSSIKSRINYCLNSLPKIRYVMSSYILHVQVEDVYYLDTSDSWLKEMNTSATIAFCQTLDTMKGRIFPDINNTIFALKKDSNSSASIEKYTTHNQLSFDIVFSYWNKWSRVEHPGYRSLYDSNGNTWIKRDKEYIVFLEFHNITGTNERRYLTVSPYADGLSYGMYPIENGFVIDEGNDMGWGIQVPVEQFKANIRQQIEVIKNYGK